MRAPEFKTFLLDYRFNGNTWSIDLPATSWEDAEARLRAILQTGHIEGELAARIPLTPKGGFRAFFARLFRKSTGGGKA